MQEKLKKNYMSTYITEHKKCNSNPIFFSVILDDISCLYVIYVCVIVYEVHEYGIFI